MGKQKVPIPTGLSPAVIEASRKRGTRQCIRNIIKTVIYYIISLTAFIMTERQSHFFRSVPFWFSLLLAVIVVFPIVWWKPYRILTARNFRGTVVFTRSKRAVDHADEDARGPTFDRGRMDTIDVYIIKLQSGSGKERSFAIKRDNARFGRYYYQKGDVLFCPRFSHLPYNESRPLPAPFCLWCGSIGALNETVCTCCGSPYVPVPQEGTFTPVPSPLVEKDGTDTPDPDALSDNT